MDKATLIGIVLGFILILGSILMGGTLGSFINAPGLLVVVGGTVAATLISERADRVIGGFRVAKNALSLRASDPVATMELIMELSGVARKEGVIALENRTVDDPFLAQGLRMVVDGISPEEVNETLSLEIFSMKQRHQRGQKLFRFMAATAPSMGMIGTLIGLVQMLQTLDDPSAIGPAMAVALLTTFYGAIMAFLIFGPVAEKLEKRTTEETANMRVVVDGLQAIVKGDGTAVIKEKLEAHLSPQARKVA